MEWRETDAEAIDGSEHKTRDQEERAFSAWEFFVARLTQGFAALLPGC